MNRVSRINPLAAAGTPRALRHGFIPVPFARKSRKGVILPALARQVAKAGGSLAIVDPSIGPEPQHPGQYTRIRAPRHVTAVVTLPGQPDVGIPKTVSEYPVRLLPYTKEGIKFVSVERPLPGDIPPAPIPTRPSPAEPLLPTWDYITPDVIQEGEYGQPFVQATRPMPVIIHRDTPVPQFPVTIVRAGV